MEDWGTFTSDLTSVKQQSSSDLILGWGAGEEVFLLLSLFLLQAVLKGMPKGTSLLPPFLQQVAMIFVFSDCLPIPTFIALSLFLHNNLSLPFAGALPQR